MTQHTPSVDPHELSSFIVNVREVHIQMKRVLARSAEDAIQRVRNGDGEDIDNSLEYSHTLNHDTWTADPESQ